MRSSAPELAWLAALQDPQLARAWPLDRWEVVIRLARRSRLLGRLAEAMNGAALLDELAQPVQQHLRSEVTRSRWRIGVTRWAALRIGNGLLDAPYPRVLLKGAAYIAQDLPIAAGRLPSDLDILLPKEHLEDALRRLSDLAWEPVPMDEHDQRYYREWSHEAPPMRHAVHPVELDVHHNILPPVARIHIDAAALFTQLQSVAWPGWSVLHPVDQVLHSAAHLTQDSELRDRLRDLVDLDGLCRHHGADAEFWPRLVERAAQLGLGEPLALVTGLLSTWFGTPIPEASARAIRLMGPGPLRRTVLNGMLRRVLMPTHPDHLPSLAQEIAGTLILTRYHLHRLPLHLLVPHLWRKWRMGLNPSATGSAPTAP